MTESDLERTVLFFTVGTSPRWSTRKFVHILEAICFIGFLLPIVDAQRQTFADKIINTYVVKGVEKKPFSVDLWMPPNSAQPG